MTVIAKNISIASKEIHCDEAEDLIKLPVESVDPDVEVELDVDVDPDVDVEPEVEVEEKLSSILLESSLHSIPSGKLLPSFSNSGEKSSDEPLEEDGQGAFE